jgi:aldehyde dehydrogenase (NAD+)
MSDATGQEVIRSRYNHLINGEYQPPATDTYFSSINPATEAEITEVATGNEADVDAAVEAAQSGFRSWRATDPVDRGQIVHNIAELIRDHAEELATIESLDQGKPLSQSKSDVEGAARYFEYYAGIAGKLEGKSIPVGADKLDFTVREPYGVSAQIIPWNFPANLYARGVAPALVTGNAVVAKPAPTTPISAFRLTELCHEAGVPRSAVNVVAGAGEAGEALTSHENIDCITFTGSVPTGQRVMQSAAEQVTPVTLELGGKNPAIVYPDADLETAVDSVITGIFSNSGQICSAADRALVHQSVHDEFVEQVVSVVESYEVAPGMTDPDMGPVNSAEHLNNIQEYLDLAQREDVTIETGGRQPGGDGYFIEPTVITDVDGEGRLAQEEIFGPVLVVILFDDDDDEIAIANNTEYGLTAGVFTSDITRALNAATRIDAGNVYINQWFGDTNQTPFGGYNKSGIGREKGLEALESYLQTKNIAIDIGHAE